MSGQAANPGIIGVFSAQISATSHPRLVMLKRVALLPLPGFRLPRLAHVGVLYHNGDYASRTVTWPPGGADGKGQALVKPLAGAVIWPGARDGRPPSIVVYGLTASGLGAYATAGIRLVYEVGGQTSTAVLHQAAFLWYYPRHLSPAANKADTRRYNLANSRANRALDSLTGGQA